jgi:Tfp pilus assembly protein PilV
MAKRANCRGQSMTEILVIVALVAIGTIGLVGFYGNNMRSLFGTSSHSLSGRCSMSSGQSRRFTNYAESKNMTNFGMNGTNQNITMMQHGC